MMKNESKLILPERLRLRANERQQGIEQRKLGKQNGYSVSEEISYFDCTFGAMKSSFTKKLETCDSSSKENLNSIFDELTKDLQKMQKFIGDSTMFLPSYDIKRSQETIKELEELFKEKEESLQPKKKFGFKGKKKKNAELKGKLKDTSLSKDPGKSKVIDKAKSVSCGFSNKEKELLVMNAEEICKKDVALSNLVECDVRLYGAPSTLHINNLTRCNVYVGPVQTSVFLQDCNNSVFLLACQQLRAHGVENSHFYLQITSRAIIEDCHGLKFAPYNWKYKDQEKHYDVAGLDKHTNNWDSVDDFNWLALNTPSPNWSVLPRSERKQF